MDYGHFNIRIVTAHVVDTFSVTMSTYCAQQYH